LKVLAAPVIGAVPEDGILVVIMQTNADVEDLLSQPSAQDIDFFGRLQGDLLVLGAAGKMGPTLVRRAVLASQGRVKVYAVSRANPGYAEGAHHLAADLLNPRDVQRLPDVANIVYLVGRKFGSTGNEPLTWATNAIVPTSIGQRFAGTGARIVALSTGNVYPFVPVESGGAAETTATEPVGEYAQSALARERIFQYFAQEMGTPTAIIRLNYAVEPRYGVVVDLARKILAGTPIDLTMGYVNFIWQGDANSVCLRALEHASAPAAKVINLTGLETHSVSELALRIASALQATPPLFTGGEASTALLSNASESVRLFGPPEVSTDQVIGYVAKWLRTGGEVLDKPTHFEVRSGKF
jgi:nucleoside-diphosphate-sugar epimerase